MKTHPRRPVLVGIALAVLLALGFGVAYVIGDELGIRSEPADIPAESLTAMPATPTVAPPEFTGIAAPATARLDLAVDELRAAVAEAEATDGTATLDVVVGEGPADDETYRLEGDANALRIVAAGETGAVRGVYDLAAAVRDRRSVTEQIGWTI